MVWWSTLSSIRETLQMEQNFNVLYWATLLFPELLLYCNIFIILYFYQQILTTVLLCPQCIFISFFSICSSRSCCKFCSTLKVKDRKKWENSKIKIIYSLLLSTKGISPFTWVPVWKFNYFIRCLLTGRMRTVFRTECEDDFSLVKSLKLASFFFLLFWG